MKLRHKIRALLYNIFHKEKMVIKTEYLIMDGKALLAKFKTKEKAVEYFMSSYGATATARVVERDQVLIFLDPATYY